MLSCPQGVWLPLLLFFSIEGNLTRPQSTEVQNREPGVSHLKTQAILSTLPAPEAVGVQGGRRSLCFSISDLEIPL